MKRPIYAKRLTPATAPAPGEPQPVAPHDTFKDSPSCEMRRILAATDLHLAACYVDSAVHRLSFVDWYPGEHVRLLCRVKTMIEDLQAATRRLDTPPW